MDRAVEGLALEYRVIFLLFAAGDAAQITYGYSPDHMWLQPGQHVATAGPHMVTAWTTSGYGLEYLRWQASSPSSSPRCCS